MNVEQFKSVEELVSKGEKLVEVELMLTPKEWVLFADYCKENGVKFNDWIRKLGYAELSK